MSPLVQPLVLAAAIYRCVAPDGIVAYSDAPCPGGQTLADVAHPALLLPGLDAAERRALERLHRRLERDAVTAKKARRAARREGARASADRAQRCEAARRGLDALRKRRREGYSLSEAAALDAEQARLEAERGSRC